MGEIHSRKPITMSSGLGQGPDTPYKPRITLQPRHGPCKSEIEFYSDHSPYKYLIRTLKGPTGHL